MSDKSCINLFQVQCQELYQWNSVLQLSAEGLFNLNINLKNKLKMKIHLNSKQGLYEVETYGRNSITLSTKHNTFQVPTDDFKSFAGGLWNHQVTKEEMDTFLSVVQPEKYKKQFQLENEIISLAKRIDMIDTFNTPVTAPVVVEEEDDYLDYDPQEPTKEDYERWFRQESDKNYELNNKIESIARKVYSQNLDFSDYDNKKGIKFIIQENEPEENLYRLCWDPFGFVSNYHSNISSIYDHKDWYTKNGGWIKVFENDVVLYYKSGDYGVYDDAIAIECAKKLFPGKNIHSFAGRDWDDELDQKFYDLPF